MTTIVTTSWDDGHALDLKLASLLSQYGIAGTFYIAPENRQIPPSRRLGPADIRQLAGNFEIGAHTMTHPDLCALDAATASGEITGGKKVLEDVTGAAVTSFCYPSGSFREDHKEMVRNSGFSLARTTKRFHSTPGTDRFETPTTLHAYRHWSDALPIFKNVPAGKFLKNYLNWDDLAIGLFEKIRATGGIFHLWGHSWEIDACHDWGRLERVLKHIGGHEEIIYAANRNIF